MAASTAVQSSPGASTDDSLDQTEYEITGMPSSGPLSGGSKKRLFDESSSSDEDSEEGGAQLEDNATPAFKVNEEYARRFEHNKKREERQRLEEKYGTAQANKTDTDEDSDSSANETEDEAGFLATEDLDAEISATLQALRSKDPRIYDPSATFYAPFDESSASAASKKGKEKEKPVFLQDYHRERYMKGDVGADFDDQSEPIPPTYAQEQADIKKSIVDEINALAADDSDDEGESEGEDFIKRRPGQIAPVATADGVHPSRARRVQLTELDVANADKDPDLFLSNFMASRAWAPTSDPKWEAFESDEDDDDHLNMAEEFENAYNMRFEDPEKSNEVLKTYSRTLVADRTVRREEKKGRKKQRELEKERKEAEKQERREERARLRRLKVEETEEKLRKIKHAAGLSGKTLKDEEWTKLLDDAWDNDAWEAEMLKRFGENYYAEPDDLLESTDEDEASASKKRKPKKPKWDDEIDIKDIVPDFDDSLPPNLTLSDDEGGDEEEDGEAAAAVGNSSDDDEGDEDEDEQPTKKRKTTRDHKKDRVAARRTARQERLKIEALVDRQMELDNPEALGGTVAAGSSRDGARGRAAPTFRYRETSPTSFGLTARDILLAPSDAALNEFAGLKKLASFRDPEKKRKDKKRLGKKARLRQWRRDNFGKEFEQTGPTFGFEQQQQQEEAEGGDGGRLERREKKKQKGGRSEEQRQEKEESVSRKRKRSRGKKTAAA